MQSPILWSSSPVSKAWSLFQSIEQHSMYAKSAESSTLLSWQSGYFTDIRLACPKHGLLPAYFCIAFVEGNCLRLLHCQTVWYMQIGVLSPAQNTLLPPSFGEKQLGERFPVQKWMGKWKWEKDITPSLLAILLKLPVRVPGVLFAKIRRVSTRGVHLAIHSDLYTFQKNSTSASFWMNIAILNPKWWCPISLCIWFCSFPGVSIFSFFCFIYFLLYVFRTFLPCLSIRSMHDFCN